jgi:hypothetical protein
MFEWLEVLIERVSQPRSSSVIVVVLIVLMLGAGSLYMLLNSSA